MSNLIDMVEYKARIKFKEDMKRNEDINKKIKEIQAERHERIKQLFQNIPAKVSATVTHIY